MTLPWWVISLAVGWGVAVLGHLVAIRRAIERLGKPDLTR
jgi:hypothetical protein